MAPRIVWFQLQMLCEHCNSQCNINKNSLTKKISSINFNLLNFPGANLNEIHRDTGYLDFINIHEFYEHRVENKINFNVAGSLIKSARIADVPSVP